VNLLTVIFGGIKRLLEFSSRFFFSKYLLLLTSPMPKSSKGSKGTAWEKPGINSPFRQQSRAAQVSINAAAAAQRLTDSGSRDKLFDDLRRFKSLVSNAGLTHQRKADVNKAVAYRVRAMVNKDRLREVCNRCTGNTHSAHHFFCTSRERANGRELELFQRIRDELSALKDRCSLADAENDAADAADTTTTTTTTTTDIAQQQQSAVVPPPVAGVAVVAAVAQQQQSTAQGSGAGAAQVAVQETNNEGAVLSAEMTDALVTESQYRQNERRSQLTARERFERDGCLIPDWLVLQSTLKKRLKMHHPDWMWNAVLHVLRKQTESKAFQIMTRLSSLEGLQRSLSRRDDTTGTVVEPYAIDSIMLQRKVYTVNWEMFHLELYEGGCGSVPCGNSECEGLGNGVYDTMPINDRSPSSAWSHNTAAPRTVVDENGLTHPLVALKSVCRTCRQTFWHSDGTVLSRLPPDLRSMIDVDPHWSHPKGDYAFTIGVNVGHSTDTVSCQGTALSLRKIREKGALKFSQMETSYFYKGQVWWKQLQDLVSDSSWNLLSLPEQRVLAHQRGEFLYHNEQANKVDPIPHADLPPFSLAKIDDDTLTRHELKACEARRPLLVAQLCGSVAEAWVAIDWTKKTGELLGNVWAVTVTNENGVLIGFMGVDSTKIDKVYEYLTAISARRGFTAKVAVIDNVPTNFAKSGRSDFIDKIKSALGVDYVVQDRFHVTHNFSHFFNNYHNLFYKWIITDFRNATTVRDAVAVSRVDSALLHGNITKKGTFRGQQIVIKGMSVTIGGKGIIGGTRADISRQEMEDCIEQWKDSGAYFNLFSEGRSVIVPTRVKSPGDVQQAMKRWQTELEPLIFDGSGTPIRNDRGMVLIATREDFNTHVKNVIARLKNCAPPPNCLAYVETGKRDQNGMPEFKPQFHTCYNESIHATLPEFLDSSSASKELAMARFIEGTARLAMKKQAELGSAEELSHFRLDAALEVNSAAGFNAAAAATSRLVASIPHRVIMPPSVGPGDFFVHKDVGRWDKKRPKKRKATLAGAGSSATDASAGAGSGAGSSATDATAGAGSGAGSSATDAGARSGAGSSTDARNQPINIIVFKPKLPPGTRRRITAAASVRLQLSAQLEQRSTSSTVPVATAPMLSSLTQLQTTAATPWAGSSGAGSLLPPAASSSNSLSLAAAASSSNYLSSAAATSSSKMMPLMSRKRPRPQGEETTATSSSSSSSSSSSQQPQSAAAEVEVAPRNLTRDRKSAGKWLCNCRPHEGREKPRGRQPNHGPHCTIQQWVDGSIGMVPKHGDTVVVSVETIVQWPTEWEGNTQQRAAYLLQYGGTRTFNNLAKAENKWAK
jgi:hypothetical protein